jgi:hypothetical protein
MIVVSCAGASGVVVHIANQDAGASVDATSNNEGRFSFLLLAPGRYEVQACRADFDTLVVKPTMSFILIGFWKSAVSVRAVPT